MIRVFRAGLATCQVVEVVDDDGNSVPNGSGGWTSTGSTPPTVTNVSDGPLTVKVVVTRPGYDPAEDTTTIAITPANTSADSDG